MNFLVRQPCVDQPPAIPANIINSVLAQTSAIAYVPLAQGHYLIIITKLVQQHGRRQLSYVIVIWNSATQQCNAIRIPHPYIYPAHYNVQFNEVETSETLHGK